MEMGPRAVPPWSPCLHRGGQFVPGLGPVSAVSVPDTLGVQRPSECAKRDLRSGLRNRKRGRLEQAPGRQRADMQGKRQVMRMVCRAEQGPPPPRGPTSPAEPVEEPLHPALLLQILSITDLPLPSFLFPIFSAFPPRTRERQRPYTCVCSSLPSLCLTHLSLCLCLSLHQISPRPG